MPWQQLFDNIDKIGTTALAAFALIWVLKPMAIAIRGNQNRSDYEELVRLTVKMERVEKDLKDIYDRIAALEKNQ